MLRKLLTIIVPTANSSDEEPGLVKLLVGRASVAFWSFLFLAFAAAAVSLALRSNWDDKTRNLLWRESAEVWQSIIGGTQNPAHLSPEQQVKFWKERLRQTQSNLDRELSPPELMGAALLLQTPTAPEFTTLHEWSILYGANYSGTEKELYTRSFRSQRDRFAAAATLADPRNPELLRLRALILVTERKHQPVDVEATAFALADLAKRDPDNALYDYLTAYTAWTSTGVGLKFTHIDHPSDPNVLPTASDFQLRQIAVTSVSEGLQKSHLILPANGKLLITQFATRFLNRHEATQVAGTAWRTDLTWRMAHSVRHILFQSVVAAKLDGDAEYARHLADCLIRLGEQIADASAEPVLDQLSAETRAQGAITHHQLALVHPELVAAEAFESPRRKSIEYCQEDMFQKLLEVESRSVRFPVSLEDRWTVSMCMKIIMCSAVLLVVAIGLHFSRLRLPANIRSLFGIETTLIAGLSGTACVLLTALGPLQRRTEDAATFVGVLTWCGVIALFGRGSVVVWQKRRRPAVAIWVLYTLLISAAVCHYHLNEEMIVREIKDRAVSQWLSDITVEDGLSRVWYYWLVSAPTLCWIAATLGLISLHIGMMWQTQLRKHKRLRTKRWSLLLGTWANVSCSLVLTLALPLGGMAMYELPHAVRHQLRREQSISELCDASLIKRRLQNIEDSIRSDADRMAEIRSTGESNFEALTSPGLSTANFYSLRQGPP